MKLFIDCTNGISGDMVWKALMDLGADRETVEKGLAELGRRAAAHGDCAHSHGHGRGHSFSYKEILGLLTEAILPHGARQMALNTYRAIALAEAEVHGETLETVHFHEVGRWEAITNIVGVALALHDLAPEVICCSAIHDGHGTITCSHGEIPVPVPAVTAMKKQCSYTFVTDDVETEMVTPSGLALLIGMGARTGSLEDLGPVEKTGRGKGGRDLGRDGLRIHRIAR